MEGGQERDSSPDEQRHIIDDDDMEASPTDSADLWLPERNEEDTMFVRALKDAIPTKKRPQSVSELAIVQQRKNLFRDSRSPCVLESGQGAEVSFAGCDCIQSS